MAAPGASRTFVIGPKINLLLEVDPPRPDGYHPLRTVFLSLEPVDLGGKADSFHDLLTLEIGVADSQSEHSGGAGPAVVFTCNDPNLANGNLVEKAIYAALSAVVPPGEPTPTVCAHLHKNIPHGAGLGGGSMDAACALVESIDLLGGTSSLGSQLPGIALGLGSDVPFGIIGGCCYAEGRGEVLTALPGMITGFVVIAVPPVIISTTEAFSWIDEDRALAPGRTLETSTASVISAYDLAEGDEMSSVTGLLHNDFEESVLSRFPEVAALKSAAISAGASGSLLSGSGSAVFAITDDIQAADSAAAGMKSAVPGTRVAVMRPADTVWRRAPTPDATGDSRG